MIEDAFAFAKVSKKGTLVMENLTSNMEEVSFSNMSIPV